MSTLFSSIISGDIPSYCIYQDQYVYAFLDIYPTRIGHTLVVPRIEVDHFADVPEPYYSAIHTAAKLLAPAIQQATGCTRVCTQFVGYEVPHAHYHLIPTDTLYDMYVHSPPRADDTALQDMQAKIISYLV